MQKFFIGPMCVTKEDFEQQLNSCGLKFGYIKRLYEKWKEGDLTYFRVIIEGCPFVIFTDDENSYPEIEEETGKKIEEYSLEWLENLFYQSTIVGPISYESLMPQLQTYVRIKKAEQKDEEIKQTKYPYCHPYKEHLIEGNNGFCCVTKDAELIAFNKADEAGSVKIKIKLCPMCGRKLEA